jgi:hypothetical protein
MICMHIYASRSTILLVVFSVLLMAISHPTFTTGDIENVNDLSTFGQEVNVTQQDYQDALTKWRAQGIREYEITLIDSTAMGKGGKLRLRIRVEGTGPRVMSYTDLNSYQPQVIPLESLGADDLAHLRDLSVEAMFSLIRDLFNGKRTNPTDPVSEYDIAFDATLGYPIHVYSRIVSRDGNLSPTECCISYEVVSLTIFESTTPGMPKSGHPDH